MDRPNLARNGDEILPEDIDRAFHGSRAARQILADRLFTAVEGVVRKILRPIVKALQRDIGQEVEDFVQDTWLLLLKNDGQILRLWDPARGRSLSSWIYLVAHRLIVRRLKSHVRHPWPGHIDLVALIDDDLTPGTDAAPDLERILDLDHLLDRLRETLGEPRWRLFRQIFIEQRAPADIAADEQMEVSQVYDLSSYFRRQARNLAANLERPRPPEAADRVRTTLCTNP